MPTETVTTSKIDAARTDLEAAMTRRDATRAEGRAAEAALRQLEKDEPMEWTGELVAEREANIRNCRKRVEALKAQLVADIAAVEQAERRLVALQERAQKLPKGDTGHGVEHRQRAPTRDP